MTSQWLIRMQPHQVHIMKKMVCRLIQSRMSQTILFLIIPAVVHLHLIHEVCFMYQNKFADTFPENYNVHQ